MQSRIDQSERWQGLEKQKRCWKISLTLNILMDVLNISRHCLTILRKTGCCSRVSGVRWPSWIPNIIVRASSRPISDSPGWVWDERSSQAWSTVWGAVPSRWSWSANSARCLARPSASSEGSKWPCPKTSNRLRTNCRVGSSAARGGMYNRLWKGVGRSSSE